MFSSIDAMWKSAINCVLDNGQDVDSRDGPCREVIGWHGELQGDRTFLQNPTRQLDPVYAAAEILWYLSGSDSIEMIKAYAPQYERFAPNGTAYGAYGPRFMPQLEKVVTVLRTANTRQAIVAMWRPDDLAKVASGNVPPDMPCTCMFQFQLRKGVLHMHTFMRSNDLWLGFPYDVFAFTCFQRLIAWWLDVQVGKYVHTVGNIHAYHRNWDKLRYCADVKGVESLPNVWALPIIGRSPSEIIDDVVKEEAAWRAGSRDEAKSVALATEWPMLGDLLSLAQSKHLGQRNGKAGSRVTSPALRAAFTRKYPQRHIDAGTQTRDSTD